MKMNTDITWLKRRQSSQLSELRASWMEVTPETCWGNHTDSWLVFTLLMVQEGKEHNKTKLTGCSAATIGALANVGKIM